VVAGDWHNWGDGGFKVQAGFWCQDVDFGGHEGRRRAEVAGTKELELAFNGWDRRPLIFWKVVEMGRENPKLFLEEGTVEAVGLAGVVGVKNGQ